MAQVSNLHAHAVTAESLVQRGFQASGRSTQYQAWEQFYKEAGDNLITYTLWDSGSWDVSIDNVFETVEQILKTPESLMA